jgi:spore maturation protein CgeB
LRFLIENPAVRERMAADGQSLVSARHTWQHRAEKLVEIVTGK